MIAVIAFLFLSINNPILNSEVIDVDRCEINTVWQDGKPQFTQVILWRWSRQRCEFQVAQWQILPNGYRRNGNVIFWSDADSRVHRAKCKSVLFTRGIDRELEERKRIDECLRIPYF